jgi:hypothetical protein
MPSLHDDIELVAADDWTIPGTLLDNTGAPLDLTNATFQWTLIDPDGEAVAPLITGSTLTIVQPPTNGAIKIFVPRNLTAPLLAGRYHDALRVIIEDATMYWMGTIAVDGDPMSLPMTIVGQPESSDAQALLISSSTLGANASILGG